MKWVVNKRKMEDVQKNFGNKRKKEEKKNKKKRGLLIAVIICILLDFGASLCLFFAYGPITYFRDLLITTAMTTKSHKYLARTIYSEKTIEKVINSNYVVDIKENTNVDDIQIGSSDEITEYESIYDEQILKRNPNDLYKMIPLEGDGYKGYLVAIYDPSRISLVSSRYYGNWGQYLEEIAKQHKAKVGINASGFDDTNQVGNGAKAAGIFIKSGKLIEGKPNTIAKLIGFNKEHVLMLMNATAQEAISQGMVDAVEFGPFLIVNGKPAEMKGNGGWGISSRTAIAQRKDGIVLFLVIDGRQPGYSMGTNIREITKILLRYKAYNAANLDGGASSSLNIEGKLVSKPCAVSPKGERPIPNAWIVK
ncbi:MAG: phosphodiester glycosidase family protein [Bacilli bacterium]|jgi:exopolysaccharide biosynthesis protein|nr:phosphodiester glycosidase family protein [Bacilli bacterium]